MNIQIIKACTDLGLTECGTEKGPKVICENLDKNLSISTIEKNNIKKSLDKNDLRKNLKDVNIFNEKLFNEVYNTLKNNEFPLTIGGDHSIGIASALASNKYNDNIGIIWIDAHLDYNTFETTITGNLHGLPLATINGLCKDLSPFSNNYINPKNTVVVGYRAKEENRDLEINNIKKAGVTVFTEEDIINEGIDVILNKAIQIASFNTSGIHVSFDLDVINPKIAKGVSVPEEGGINTTQVNQIINILKKNIYLIKSLDIVEYNPDFDTDKVTLDIAVNFINNIIEALKK